MCSIDNMPTQLPTESTDFFGNLMMPYALDIINSDATKPLHESDFKPSVYGVSRPHEDHTNQLSELIIAHN